MAITAKFGSFSKRRNSTKQPTTELNDSRTITLKEGTSIDRPVFKVTGNNFTYNYCEFDSKYYFIDEIISLHNNEIEVHCVMDALATYKTDILAGNHFVSYSSSGSNKLPDTRIPLIADKVVQHRTVVNPRFSRSGSYVLAVNGQNGCCIYRVTQQNINDLIQNVSQWMSDAENAFLNNLVAPGADIVKATENMYTVIARAGAFGNAYSEAPSQIRSCIWVPFDAATFTVAHSGKEIYLGQFATGVYADEVIATPYRDTFSGTDIPWYYNDWRRQTCEDLYIYLPLVGLTKLSTSSLIDETNLTIEYSIMPTDGSVAYEIKAGDQVIGSYGANCCANYPIGISQQASAGELINSVATGAEKMVNAAINSSVSPVSMAAAGVGVALEGVKASYDTVQIANSTHNTCVGGVGGGVGAGLDLSITLFNVITKTLISPSDMAATMGLPTMKPMSLSGLTGFCQCANAHVDAAATAGELDAIDYYLNSGFFIE